MTGAKYDTIGVKYSVQRQTDPHIAAAIHAELQGASSILNIGAGTGSYEPTSSNLTAVEPSAEMIKQRLPDGYPVIQASAENLPFANKSFSLAMSVLCMHHWEDKARAFSEINRVTSEKIVIVTWDPNADPFWLTRDYFPEIYEMDGQIFPSIDLLKNHFEDVTVQPLIIPENCIDGFLAAFWKRPEAYLQKTVRAGSSAFANMDSSRALKFLEDDLKSGIWHKNNAEILDLTELDAGYRLITASTEG